jgi:ribosomal protein L3
MGGDTWTVQNLRVVAIQGNLLLVQGAVPGSRGAIVTVTAALKKKPKRT